MEEKIDLVELNDEITKLEKDYVDDKVSFEEEKANLWLHTDFPTILNKTKPTQKDIENWIKLQLADREIEVKQLKATLDNKKRLLEILMLTFGEN